MSSLPDDDTPDNALPRLVILFEDHVQLFQSGGGREQLIAAGGYWQGYPLLDESIRFAEGATPTEIYQCRSILDRAHNAAVNCLMREAELRGLDSAPLYEGGRVCRELFANSTLYQPHRQDGVYDTWPDCLGPTRYSLPIAMQDAIHDGEAVFRRLAIMIDLPVDAPHEETFLNETERKILDLCRDKPLQSKEIADKAGFTPDYIRTVCGKLRRAGRLMNIPGEGYRSSM